MTSPLNTINAAVQDDIAAILRALGISDRARPVSPHTVVLDEILPAIERLRRLAPPPNVTYVPIDTDFLPKLNDSWSGPVRVYLRKHEGNRIELVIASVRPNFDKQIRELSDALNSVIEKATTWQPSEIVEEPAISEAGDGTSRYAG